MKKDCLLLGIIIVAFANACSSNDSVDSQGATQCSGAQGIIKNNITEISFDGNATHQNGYCLEGEKCVRVYNKIDDYNNYIANDVVHACSLYGEGWLKCDGNLVDVTEAKDHCGSCETKCESDEYCQAGHCRKYCGNGIIENNEECENGKLSKSFQCPAGTTLTDISKTEVCTSECKIDIAKACPSNCGNGSLQAEEECDGEFHKDIECESGTVQRNKYDSSMCTDECKIDKSKACQNIVCGDSYIDEGEACDFEDEEKTQSIVKDEDKCKIPKDLGWTWSTLEESSYIKTQCSSDCQSVTTERGRLCSLIDEYKYIEGGINKCEITYTATDTELQVNVSMENNEYASDKSYSWGIYCGKGTSLNAIALAQITNIVIDRSQAKYYIKANSEASVSVAKSSFEVDTNYSCFAYIRSDVTTNESVFDAYLCRTTGEPMPVKHGENVAVNIILGKETEVEVFQYSTK